MPGEHSRHSLRRPGARIRVKLGRIEEIHPHHCTALVPPAVKLLREVPALCGRLGAALRGKQLAAPCGASHRAVPGTRGSPVARMQRCGIRSRGACNESPGFRLAPPSRLHQALAEAVSGQRSVDASTWRQLPCSMKRRIEDCRQSAARVVDVIEMSGEIFLANRLC